MLRIRTLITWRPGLRHVNVAETEIARGNPRAAAGLEHAMQSRSLLRCGPSRVQVVRTGPELVVQYSCTTVRVKSAVTSDLRFTGLVPPQAAYPLPSSPAPALVYPRQPGREPVAANPVQVAGWQMHRFTQCLLTFEVQIPRKWWIKVAESAPLARSSLCLSHNNPFHVSALRIPLEISSFLDPAVPL